MNNNTALLIIDAQVNMFDPKHSVYEASEVLNRLQKLLSLARASGTQIVFIQNNGQEGEADQPRTTGWLLHSDLAVQNGDLVVQKSTNDIFQQTGLADRLRRQGVQKLIIAGLQSEYCIAASCRMAHELGFGVTLVSDAHSTYDQAGESAADIRERINRELKAIVTLWRIEEVQL
jgi:streptothricin hydrolase